MHKILIVEDDKTLRDAFVILLELQGYKVDQAGNGKEALERCKDTTYDLILLDIMMPILDGVGFLHKADLAANAPQTRIIVMSNLSSDEVVVSVGSLGVRRTAVKADLSPRDIINIVEEELAES